MIIHDLVPVEHRIKLQNIISSNTFNWKFFADSVGEGMDSVFQFIHLVNLNGEAMSPYNDDILVILNYFEMRTGLKVKSIYRVKVNLLTRRETSKEEHLRTLHQDLEHSKNYVSMVYYVNDSDGDTVIYDDEGIEIERCSPKAGNAVFFMSDMQHAGTIPQKNDTRVVINFVFEIEENV